MTTEHRENREHKNFDGLRCSPPRGTRGLCRRLVGRRVAAPMGPAAYGCVLCGCVCVCVCVRASMRMCCACLCVLRACLARVSPFTLSALLAATVDFDCGDLEYLQSRVPSYLN